MNLLVVALLAGLWASILLPGVLRAHRDASPLGSIDSFERSMTTLAGRNLRVLDRESIVRSGARARVARRRRAILVRLSAAVGVAAVVAMVAGGLAWLLVAVTLVALGAYVTLLLRVQAREEEARRKVTRLPQRPVEPEHQNVQIRRWGA